MITSGKCKKLILRLQTIKLGVHKNMETKENKTPRISINKLGEYLLASPSRRRRIIYDAKYPSTYIFNRYNDAEKAIADYYSRDDRNIDLILGRIGKIQSKTTQNDHQIEVAKSNLEALDSFIDCVDSLNFIKSNYTYHNYLDTRAKITINDLVISLRPEIIVKSDDKIVGALKLYFSKTYPMEEKTGEYITTVIKHYLEKEHECVIKSKDCLALGIFTKNIVTAPKAYKQRFKDIEAASQEIVSQWETIKK
jgi:hypothetical protein